MSFDALHPGLQHHIVNSLGWHSLRPLQEQAIMPLVRSQARFEVVEKCTQGADVEN